MTTASSDHITVWVVRTGLRRTDVGLTVALGKIPYQERKQHASFSWGDELDAPDIHGSRRVEIIGYKRTP